MTVLCTQPTDVPLKTHVPVKPKGRHTSDVLMRLIFIFSGVLRCVNKWWLLCVVYVCKNPAVHHSVLHDTRSNNPLLIPLGGNSTCEGMVLLSDL